jgi:hypothetical protein
MWSLSGSIVPPPVDRAMCADVIARGLRPKVLEKRTRISLPPTDTRTTCLSVLLTTPGFGGTFRGSGIWGAHAQVPTHLAASGAEAGVQNWLRESNVLSVMIRKIE